MTAEQKRDLKSAILAFISLWAIVWTINFSFRDPVSIILYFFLFFFFRFTADVSPKEGRHPIRITAAIYTLFSVLKAQDRTMEYFESGVFLTLTFVVLICGWYILLLRLLELLVKVLNSEKARSFLRRREEGKGRIAAFRRHILLYSFLILILCWLPWFLYSYPGIFDPDPINQIEQFLGMKPWSNHHPVAHTLLMGACFNFGKLLGGDMNFCIACYTAFQSIFLAFSCALLIRTLDRVLKLRFAVSVIVLAFFALVPFMPVQALLVGKDTVFASVAILFCCLLAETVYAGAELGTVASVLRCVLLNLTAVLFCLFRTNGWYAYLFVSLCFIFCYRKKLLSALLHVLPAVLIAGLIRGPVYDSFGIVKPDMAESLHVPTQQIACVIARGHEISEKDRELIEAVVEIDRIPELYVNWFADNIKELIRAGHPEVIEENKGAYLGLWIRLGLRHPLDYLSAWTGLAGNIFYPEGDYDVASIEGVYPNDLGITQQPLIHGSVLVQLRASLIRIGNFLPLYGFLWSMGSYFWVLILALLLLILQRSGRERLLILMPALGVILTLFLAIPSAKLFRYGFSYIVLTPLVLCVFCLPEKGERS
ncbi:MAG: hypothetical protein IK115_13720 [Lachnospiraceae bacterium]|nr:hypothetical protein [Lachnospiraceae bacterium]